MGPVQSLVEKHCGLIGLAEDAGSTPLNVKQRELRPQKSIAAMTLRCKTKKHAKANSVAEAKHHPWCL
jgi:hypothetical protein